MNGNVLLTLFLPSLAYSSLSEHQRAKECYQKALELEPDNDSYRSNLAIAEEKLQSEPQQQQQPGNAFGGFGRLSLV